MIKKNLKLLKLSFKFITYNFFKLLYGKVSEVIEYKSNKKIKTSEIKLDDSKKNIYEINKGRLYTDTIHNTAIILDNKIVNGPSIQLVENNFESANKNIVLKIGTPRFKKTIKGTVLSTLTGGGGNSNYWHWLFDVLPRIHMASKAVDIKKIDYYLFPNLNYRFQKETLDLLNIPVQKRMSCQKYRHINFSNLIVTDHPYVDFNSHEDGQKMPKWIFNWLKQNFIFKKDNEIKPVKKIFIAGEKIDKHHKKQRGITNEVEIKKILEKKNFELHKLSELSFIEQINLFQSAKTVVGLHGAGFANIIFCKENTNIIEIRNLNTGKIIENLSNQNSLIYKKIECETEDQKKLPNAGFVNIDVSLFEKTLDEINH